MAIPASTLATVKSLLRIADTDRDTVIAECYERVLHRTVQRYDWFKSIELLNAVANQSIYTAASSTVRILGIDYNGVALRKTTASSQDLLNNGWQASAVASSGTPDVWWINQLPPIVDALSGITPIQFIIHPPPSGNGTNAITVHGVSLPGSDAPAQLWVIPFLVYRTVSEFIRQSVEEREQDTAAEEVSMLTSQFFDAVADVWENVIEGVIPQ